MTSPIMKSVAQKTSFRTTGRIWLSALVAVLAWGALAGTAAAAVDDSNLTLNSSDGGTQFSIQNAGGTDVIMMNSLGGAVFESSVTVSSNTVLPGTTIYVGGVILAGGPIVGNSNPFGIRPNTNSLTALQLQTANGTRILDVDTTNSRIGIMNNAPAQALDVTGSIALSAGIVGSASPTTIRGAATVTSIQLQTNGGANILDVDSNNSRIGIGNATPAYTLDVTGSARVSQGLLLSSLTAVKVGAYTALTTDYIVRCNSNGGAFTITLPTAVGFTGLQFIIKDVNGTAGTGGKNITVNGTGGQTIDGAATYVINTNYGAVKVFSDGANWFTISHQ